MTMSWNNFRDARMPLRAKIDGKFPEYSYPTDEVLELKRRLR